MNKQEIFDSITVFYEENKVGLLILFGIVAAIGLFFYFYYYTYMFAPKEQNELEATVVEYYTYATRNGPYQKLTVKIDYNGIVNLETFFGIPSLKKGDEVIILENTSEKGGKKYRFIRSK